MKSSNKSKDHALNKGHSKMRLRRFTFCDTSCCAGCFTGSLFIKAKKTNKQTNEKRRGEREARGGGGGGGGCADVQFSGDSFPAFNDRRKIKNKIEDREQSASH